MFFFFCQKAGTGIDVCLFIMKVSTVLSNVAYTLYMMSQEQSYWANTLATVQESVGNLCPWYNKSNHRSGGLHVQYMYTNKIMENSDPQLTVTTQQTCIHTARTRIYHVHKYRSTLYFQHIFLWRALAIPFFSLNTYVAIMQKNMTLNNHSYM